MSLERSFLTTASLSSGELGELFALAEEGKRSNWRDFSQSLKGLVAGLLFFNPSLRTRASFQAGIARLGGESVCINSGSDSWKLEFEKGAVMNSDKAEHVIEAAKVLSAYFDFVCVRSFAELLFWQEDRSDKVIQSFAKELKVPLISMESALWHPCQALADGLTMWERFKGKFSGKKFVLTWANHPKQLPMAVPNSAALMAAQLGMDVRIVCPENYLLSPECMSLISAQCETNKGTLEIYHDQAVGFAGADVVYAKSWTPPGFVGKAEQELSHRSKLGWTVTQDLMARTREAIFMHCLPVRRNVVVEDAVLDGKSCLIEAQAANRVHAQNALILKMLGLKR